MTYTAVTDNDTIDDVYRLVFLQYFLPSVAKSHK